VFLVADHDPAGIACALRIGGAPTFAHWLMSADEGAGALWATAVPR
jgi:hypothetical protein